MLYICKSIVPIKKNEKVNVEICLVSFSCHTSLACSRIHRLYVMEFDAVCSIHAGTCKSTGRTQAEYNGIQRISQIMWFYQGGFATPWHFFLWWFLKLVHLKYQFSIVYNCFQANSQWRKVQDRLEDDERCSRLEKIDRLEVFQVIHFILLSLFYARWVSHDWHTTCDTIHLPRDRSLDNCVRWDTLATVFPRVSLLRVSLFCLFAYF